MPIKFRRFFFTFQWKENVTLTESQVQALALSRQASQELDVKRREAIYNDVLTKQQMVKQHWLSMFNGWTLHVIVFIM